MNVFLLWVEGIDNINMKNLVMKIQVSGMIFMTALEVVVMVMVVVGVLVMKTSVQEVIVDMVAVFALMMKMNLKAAMRRDLMMMRILLQTIGGLNVIEITIMVLVMMVNNIVVAIGMIRTTLLVSSKCSKIFRKTRCRCIS